jgi:hypothetical protein
LFYERTGIFLAQFPEILGIDRVRFAAPPPQRSSRRRRPHFL